MCNISYSLKPATIEDYDFIFYVKKTALKQYIEKIWGWDEEYQQDDFRKCFLPQNNKIIVCNDEEVGFLEVNEKENIIYIVELEILPQYQGKGIGTSIISDIIQHSRSVNKKLEIGCFKINLGASRLYERLGFKVIGERETHFILAVSHYAYNNDNKS